MVTLTSSAFDAALLVRRPGAVPATGWWTATAAAAATPAFSSPPTRPAAWQILATSPDVAGGAYHITVVKNANPLVPTALVEFDYAYDKAGNLLTATENQSASTAAGLGAVTADQYDALGRLTQTRQSVGGTVNKRADFVYNADGSTQFITRYSNDGATTVATSTYTNDGMGRLTAIVDKHGATTLADYAWTYDQASRVTGIASQTNPGDNTNGASGITYDVNVRRNT